ncbi:hypothetical protein FACS1894124_3690 [Spirochaetia bacterium]|nr:hypothetical protein FACS1894124_3690 [Spirochaetia bacterium]
MILYIKVDVRKGPVFQKAGTENFGKTANGKERRRLPGRSGRTGRFGGSSWSSRMANRFRFSQADPP